MKYLTAEELKIAHRQDAHEILEQCAGKSVRDLFAIQVFNQHHDLAFPERARTKVLDIGIASGAFLAQLLQAGYRELYGTDIDDYVKPEVKASLRGFKTLDMSWERLPWSDAFFDAATAWCVLPHLENPFHAIRELHRVLAPGGIFIFTAPHLASKPSIRYFSRKKDFRSYRATNNHIVLFTAGVIAKTVLKYFDLIDTEYHVRPKIFLNPVGKLREFVWHALGVKPSWQKALAKRWAYNAVYILRKRT